MKAFEVGLVVPTRNSQGTIEACLLSLRRQSVPCLIVVVDNHSTDGTRRIASRLADQVLLRGPERSAQRNAGAAALGCQVVGFIDSDMVLDTGVAEEAAALVRGGAGVVIVPERSQGKGFWSAVRSYERSFYLGQDQVEAARFFDHDVFDRLGGFDTGLDAGEDWDLTIRAREVSEVARTISGITHNEGYLHFFAACAKKASYSPGIQAFASKHGLHALLAALDRPYFRRPCSLLGRHPILGAGVLALKAGEAAAVGWRLLRASAQSRSTSRA